MRCMATCSAFLFVIVTAGLQQAAEPGGVTSRESRLLRRRLACPRPPLRAVSNWTARGTRPGSCDEGDYVDGSEGVQAETQGRAARL